MKNINIEMEKNYNLNNLINIIPSDLKQRGKFCLWKYSDTKRKIPYNPHTMKCADPSNSETFASFDQTYKVYEDNSENYNGMGLGIFDGISAIDIDHCIIDGELSLLAKEVISIMDNSYVEISPSGEGIRILFSISNFGSYKEIYQINNRELGLKVYIAGVTNRYVTVTGSKYGSDEFGDRTEQVKIVLEKFMKKNNNLEREISQNRASLSLKDEEILSIAKTAKNASKFNALWSGDTNGYPSTSEADAALCAMLAFYTNNNEEQVDRLFRQSGLMRSKWYERNGDGTYGSRTIAKAIEFNENTYDANYYSSIGKKDYHPQNSFVEDDIKTILAKLKPEDNTDFSRNEIGNSKLFSEIYKNKTRYIVNEKCWYLYNGSIWSPEAENITVMSLLNNLVEELNIYSYTIESKNVADEYRKYVKAGWEKRNKRLGIIEDAKVYCKMDSNQFDSNPYLLNCENGVFDLKNNKFINHHPSLLLSKKARANYDPNAKLERFDQFVMEITEGDIERAKMLQKCLGYSLIGDAKEECFFIALGQSTRNGKSTLFDTIRHLLGSYAVQLNFTTIAKQSFTDSGKATPDLARSNGARLILVSDPPKGKALDESLIKQMTGRDMINARYLYGNPMEFKSIAKIFMVTNSMPNISDDSIFRSNRLKILPFDKYFSEEEREVDLKEKFKTPEALSAILNWLIEGYYLYLKEGLKNTPEMDLLLAYYSENSNYVGRFLKDEVEIFSGGTKRLKIWRDLYTKYQAWCKVSELEPLSFNSFKKDLELNGVNFHEIRNNTCTFGEFKNIDNNTTFSNEEYNTDVNHLN